MLDPHSIDQSIPSDIDLEIRAALLTTRLRAHEETVRNAGTSAESLNVNFQERFERIGSRGKHRYGDRVVRASSSIGNMISNAQKTITRFLNA